MLFRIYIGSYLPSGKRLHVVEVNIQWWRYKCALYSVAPNTMAWPVQKHHVVKSNVTWMDIRLGACESKQNGRLVRQYSYHSNSVLSRRNCFTKKNLVLNQVIAALRRSVGLLGWFVAVWKSRHTHTHNYCNPAVHACRGLIRKEQCRSRCRSRFRCIN